LEDVGLDSLPLPLPLSMPPEARRSAARACFHVFSLMDIPADKYFRAFSFLGKTGTRSTQVWNPLLTSVSLFFLDQGTVDQPFTCVCRNSLWTEFFPPRAGDF